MTQHLAAALFDVAAKSPGAPALGQRVAGRWVTQSFEELAGSVRRLANALISERLLPAETAVIIAPAGPSWFLAHFAVLAAGGVVIPVDESSSAEETYAIIRETEARVALVAGDRAHETIHRLRPRLPSLRIVIALDDSGEDDDEPLGPAGSGHAGPVDVTTSAGPEESAEGQPRRGRRPAGRHRPGADAAAGLAGAVTRARQAGRDRSSVLALGRLEQLPYDVATAAEARRRQEAWSGADVAAVHYMPSPAGLMRGAVVTHASSLYPVRAIAEIMPLPDHLDLIVSLPITQAVPYWAALTVLLHGGTVWSLEPGGDLAGALREIRPNVVVGTVSTAEGLVEQAREDVRSRLAVSADIEEWALRIAAEADAVEAAGKHLSPSLAVQRRAADVRVFAPMRARMGGAKALTLLGGQSMPSQDLMTWLRLLDQEPVVGWGSRETCALATLNRPDAARAGSVGLPLPGTQVRIADSGEVLVRGPGIMRGYYGRPAETRAALADGWLHSGQSGRLDEEGFLFLTSRVDDIILTAALQYVSPRPIERALEEDPVVAEAVVIGDARLSLTVLVHPDVAALRELLGPDAPEDDDALLDDPRAVRAVGDAVRRVNHSTSEEVERLTAFRLLATPLGPATVMSGSAMTRRQRALQDHAAVIDAMYATLEAARKPGRGA